MEKKRNKYRVRKIDWIEYYILSFVEKVPFWVYLLLSGVSILLSVATLILT